MPPIATPNPTHQIACPFAAGQSVDRRLLVDVNDLMRHRMSVFDEGRNVVFIVHDDMAEASRFLQKVRRSMLASSEALAASRALRASVFCLPWEVFTPARCCDS